ncbi:MAG TPA: MYXO-CTERM sorting domain-containing protein, partial [Minicystis sp.]|nr:MYXO-CTERM sorting domain-containing protein [Minicystis sp.]
SDVRVEVRVDGRSLGARTLSVGTDPFNSAAAVDATSGACATTAPGGAGTWLPAGALAIVALGVAARRRRSTRGSS